MSRLQRVPVIPVEDQAWYLEELEQLFKESHLRWYFEYLEDRMFRNGYIQIYDSMAAWFLYTRGFRVIQGWGNKPPRLCANLVSKADLLSIQRTYTQLHPGTDNPYKRRRHF